MAGITPGPWKPAHVGAISRAQYVHDTADRDIAKVCDRAERDANALAIAAVPDLLAALQQALAYMDADGASQGRHTRGILEAALTKAGQL